MGTYKQVVYSMGEIHGGEYSYRNEQSVQRLLLIRQTCENKETSTAEYAVDICQSEARDTTVTSANGLTQCVSVSARRLLAPA